MNDKCAAGTGRFLEMMAKTMEMSLDELSKVGLSYQEDITISSMCTVFAESDLIHKAQVGYSKQDIIAGLCKSIVLNYLNNVGKGKKIRGPIIFQGGVSKNKGVLKYFREILNEEVIVDEYGHLMGAIGIAILSKKNKSEKSIDLNIKDINFITKATECDKCPNNCEILRIYKNDNQVDSWGSMCGKVK